MKSPPIHPGNETDFGRACYQWAWHNFGLAYAIPEQYLKARVRLQFAQRDLAAADPFTTRDAQALANNKAARIGAIASQRSREQHIARIHELEHKRDAYAKLTSAVLGAIMECSRVGDLLDDATRKQIDQHVNATYPLTQQEH